MSSPRSILQAFGSLWLAAVLLMLILVAMAYATTYEAVYGSQAALSEFYKAGWFQVLMGLMCFNLLAAMLVRFPFSRRQIGFVLAHVSIISILGGAWVTQQWGIDASVGIQEGTSTDTIYLRQEVLTLENSASHASTSLDLSPRVFGPIHPIENPGVPLLSLDNVGLKVERYLPDSEAREYVVNDNPIPSRAIEVSLGTDETEKSTWVFAGKPAKIGPIPIGFRVVTDPAELAKLLSDATTTQPTSAGMVRIEIQGKTFELPIEQCTNQAAPLGDTGQTVKVLQSLTHATVGAGGKMSNAPDRPANPAIQVEIAGPSGTTQQWAFAKFPEFSSMHSGGADAAKVTYIASQQDDAPSTPIEIIDGGQGGLHARFKAGGSGLSHRPVTMNEPIKTPWANIVLTVRQQFDHARRDQEYLPVDPPRESRSAAILLASTSTQDPQKIWIRKGFTTHINVNGTDCTVAYTDQQIPMGFELKLNRFNIGTYPGTHRPRSFESYVTFVDADTKQQHEHTISMNHPASHGPYTFYQSSYKQEPGKPSISYLSVSWDPGQPIVFAGYVGMVLGMLLSLIQRSLDRRRAERNGTSGDI